MHFLTIIGVILIAIGTVLSILGQNIDNKINSKQLNIKNDSLMTQNQDLFKKNQTLLGKIDNYQNDIELKNKKIEDLENQSQMNYYKELDYNIKKDIILGLQNKLKMAEENYPGVNFKISFSSLDSNKNTNLIVIDLYNIFLESGYEVKKPQNSIIIDNKLKIYDVPVIIVNPEYEDMALNITLCLKKYIKNLKYVTDSDYKYSTIKLQFYGLPQFYKDGTVEYR